MLAIWDVVPCLLGDVCPTLRQAGVSVAGAEPERVKKEIEDVVGLETSNCILASAKQACVLHGTDSVAWPFPASPAVCYVCNEGPHSLHLKRCLHPLASFLSQPL